MDKKAKAETNGLAVASLIFGILTLLTCWTVVLPVSQALLAFMFALLSRGNKKKCGVAKAGTLLAVIGLVFALVIAVALGRWLYDVYFGFEANGALWNSTAENIRQFFNQLGLPLDSLLNGIGGALR